jgi:Na+/proline symporter
MSQSLANADRLSLDWRLNGSFWPHLVALVFTLAAFYTADQVAGQRFLAAESPAEARGSAVWHAATASLVFLALGAIGLALYAFYQADPQRMAPEWVVLEADGDGQSAAANDALLRSEPTPGLTAETLQAQVAKGQILNPDSGLPFLDAAPLIDATTNEIRVVRLAQRTRHASGAAEIVVQRGWHHRLLPHFIAREMPWGLKGIVLAAIMAAAMSTLDACLNSLSTAVYVESRHSKRGPTHNDPDEDLRLVQTLIVLLGMAAIGCSLMLVAWPTALPALEFLALIAGVPLLAIWLLARLLPAAPARSAWAAFLAALVVMGVLILQNRSSLGLGRLHWPCELNSFWLVPLATLLGVGCGLALAGGARSVPR